jgi:K+-transporting ATPase KdpF subunit
MSPFDLAVVCATGGLFFYLLFALLFPERFA